MNRPRSAAYWLPVLVGVLLSSLGAPSQAELGPKPKARFDASASARVVVRFKSELSLPGTSTIQSAGAAASAPSLARASQAEVSQALQSRASVLGQRHGFALRTGRAVDERTQVVMADGVPTAAVLAKLNADPEVEFAVIDGRRRAAAVPNDPLYLPSPVPANGPVLGQWYLKQPEADRLTTGDEVLASIDAQHAWDITTGSSSMVVAVLDTGVRTTHPDLAGKLLSGYDMIADTTVSNDGDAREADASDPGDWVTSADIAHAPFTDCTDEWSSWHGTQVSGLIGAATNNGVGMAGVGWSAKILPVRVLGKCFGYDSDIVAGMRWAAGLPVPGIPDNPSANRARVLNLSLGDTADTVTACSRTLYATEIPKVLAAGTVVVIAAGNGNGRAVQPPGNCPGVITVAGVRHIGTKVGYSNVGTEVSLAAPAGNCVNVTANSPCLYPMVSTANAGLTTPGADTYTDGVNYAVGTSFSVPLVAGTAALMLSANPNLNPAQVKAILTNTARVFPFRGAPADDATGAVAACHAPNSADQGQCYCTTSTCGAGMLDASWAVYSAANSAPLPAISASNTVPGGTLTLSGTGGSVAGGRSVVLRQWTLLDGGGIVTSFTGGSTSGSGDTITLTPSAEGQFSVRLIVTDSAGVQGVREQTITVATPPPPSEGGGGAVSATWLAGLALAVLLVSRSQRRV